MGENLRTPVLDRQMQYCHFRIQQAINLHDDELERLERRLNLCKSKILETGEQIQQLDRQIIEAREKRDGELKRRKAGYNVMISRMKATHHQVVQELQELQTQEIDKLQHDFEMTLGELSSSSSQIIQGDLKKINKEIMNLQATIDEIKQRIEESQQQSQVEEVSDEQCTSINFGIIEELQHIAQVRNEERFSNLQQSKSKLAQCVNAIDELTRNHDIEVENLQKLIKKADKRYESTIHRIEDEEHYKMANLKGHLLEAEKRAKTLQNAASKLESDNQKQLQQTMSELDSMKRNSIVEVFDDEPDEKQIKAYESAKSMLAQLSKEMTEKDDQLVEKRKRNEALKREIGRIKHEIRFRNQQTK